MHIMKECFLPFNIALALQKDSIYTETFNIKINQLIEGGFIKKWLFDEFDRTAKKADIKISSKAEPLNIDNIQVMQGQSIWITILYCLHDIFKTLSQLITSIAIFLHRLRFCFGLSSM